MSLTFSKILNKFKDGKHSDANYNKFYRTYQELSQNKTILDYYAEGKNTVSFTTPDSNRLIKIPKNNNFYMLQQQESINFLAEIDFLECIPVTNITDNYVEVEKATALKSDFLANVLGIDYLAPKWTKLRKPIYSFNSLFLNCIWDNGVSNFGILNNSIVIIDHEALRFEYLLKNKKEIKKEWQRIKSDIQYYFSKNYYKYKIGV